MFDVHLFSAIAKAGTATPGAFCPGNRHAMLAFIRQPHGMEHDWVAAEAGICNAGWVEVSISRAETLSAENLNGKDKCFMGAFEQAMNGGFGLIVYSDPVTEEDL